MTTNLVVELVRKGIRQQEIAKIVATTLGVAEKTARNKLNGKSEWTIPEAITINAILFDNKQSIDYLFATSNNDNNAFAS